jgi:hypothetical protein
MRMTYQVVSFQVVDKEEGKVWWESLNEIYFEDFNTCEDHTVTLEIGKKGSNSC